ncbi:phytanoyl-CoA dioxygenase family protein [Pseudoalteromonas aurantia]|uniref:Phytanoyl-CoA dioxygenase n=1 Tax=Pseudoalteromonas aurantia TaxID=43654 RepID=A0ABY2W311_9GAMM|nr:phytanoyl-CoA dioxygenase family protein [Pseudoalteromonas aurantia]TMO79060.1 hypothetical protein CWC20_00120 [Pseudoalteromonas aurantia]
MRLDNDGFLILRGLVNKKDLEKIQKEVNKDFFKSNNLKEESELNLITAHKSVKKCNVKYLSMGYENKLIDREINNLVNSKIKNKISELIDKDLTYESGGSIITLFPEELTGYHVSYHQDEDVSDKNPNRIHVITPLTNEKLDLIQVLSSTHKVGTFKHSLFGPLIKIEDENLENHLKNEIDITLNFGDFLIFYTSLVHRVKDNINSDKSHWMLRFILKHKK